MKSTAEFEIFYCDQLVELRDKKRWCVAIGNWLHGCGLNVGEVDTNPFF